MTETNDSHVDNEEGMTDNRPFFRPKWRSLATMIGLFLVFFGFLFLVGGWKFATVFIVCLTVHEAGHLWAMSRCGIKLRGLYFLPGLGVAAVPDGDLGTQEDEAFIAIMGPVWGTAAGLVAFGLYQVTGAAELLSAAWLCILLNLFNLIPAAPLDGGRVIRAAVHGLSPKAAVWICLALLIGVAVVIYQISWLFAGFVLFFGWQEFRNFLMTVRLEEDYRRIVAVTQRMGEPFLQMQADVRLVVMAGIELTPEERAAHDRLAPSDELEDLLERAKKERPSHLSLRPLGRSYATDESHFCSPFTLCSYLERFKVRPRLSRGKAALYIVLTVGLVAALLALAQFCAAAMPFAEWMQPLLG